MRDFACVHACLCLRLVVKLILLKMFGSKEFPRGGSNSRPLHLLLAYKYDALTNWATGSMLSHNVISMIWWIIPANVVYL